MAIKISKHQAQAIARAISSDIKKYIAEHQAEFEAFQNLLINKAENSCPRAVNIDTRTASET